MNEGWNGEINKLDAYHGLRPSLCSGQSICQSWVPQEEKDVNKGK